MPAAHIYLGWGKFSHPKIIPVPSQPDTPRGMFLDPSVPVDPEAWTRGVMDVAAATARLGEQVLGVREACIGLYSSCMYVAVSSG